MEEEKEVIKEENGAASSEGKGNGKGLAIASMVLGLVGLVIFGLPCGILAIIFSIVSKKKGKSGMATAGLVLGIIDVVFVVIALIFNATVLNIF